MISLRNPSKGEQQLKELTVCWRIATFDGLRWVVDYAFFRDNAEMIGEAHLKQLSLWHVLYPYTEQES